MQKTITVTEIKGTGLNNLCAVGTLHFFKRPPLVHTYMYQESEPPSDQTLELSRLHIALSLLRDEPTEKNSEEVAQTPVGIASESELPGKLPGGNEFEELIKEEIYRGASAELAVLRAAEELAEMYSGTSDPYLCGKAADIRNVSDRLLNLLGGNIQEAVQMPQFGKPVILVADSLTASELAHLDRKMLLGLVIAAGTPTSRASVYARSFGIPTVISTGKPDETLDGANAVIDAAKGLVIVNPEEFTVRAYCERAEEENARFEKLFGHNGKQFVTRAGKRIKLYANIESIAEIADIADYGADGVGLFRSEFLVAGGILPSEDEMFEVYRTVAAELDGKPLAIRTFDIQSDSFSVPGRQKSEPNPALGRRGIRLSLSNTDHFRAQLRAVLRASVYGNVSVIFPMIATVNEFHSAIRVLTDAKNELRRAFTPFDEEIHVGILLETPAAVMISDRLAPLCDFFSVGTNDLAQFALACDRDNPDVADILTDGAESILRLIGIAVGNAHLHGREIGICGESAANIKFVSEFLEMGVDFLSVAPPYMLSLGEKIKSL